MSGFNAIALPEKAHKGMIDACSNNKASLVFACHASKHPDDQYLYALVAQHNERRDYTVWQYNASTESLFWGNYNLTLKQALALLSEKLNEGV